MTTKTRLYMAAAVAPLLSPHMMLRGPMVTLSPDEPAAADDPFAEQPGDREPDPNAPAPDPEPDPTPDPEPDLGEGDDPDAGGADGGDADPPPAAEAGEEDGEEERQRPKWRDRALLKERERREKLEADLKSERERAAALEALIAQPDDAEGRERVDRDAIRREVEADLTQKQRLDTLNTKLNKLFEDGQKAFPKSWEGRVKDAASALSDEMRERPDFFEAVADLDNAPAVYHELTGDPDKLAEILSMPAHRMGLELGRLSAKLATPKPKPISRAPAPITPLEKHTRESLPLDDPKVSQDEFNRRMDELEEKAAKARRY